MKGLGETAPGNGVSKLLDRDADFDVPDVRMAQHQLVKGDVARRRKGDGRQARDFMLGLIKTSRKLGLSFAYLGDRIGVNGTAERILPLPDLVSAQPT